jgi:hypothetical protein
MDSGRAVPDRTGHENVNPVIFPLEAPSGRRV